MVLCYPPKKRKKKKKIHIFNFLVANKWQNKWQLLRIVELSSLVYRFLETYRPTAIKPTVPIAKNDKIALSALSVLSGRSGSSGSTGGGSISVEFFGTIAARKPKK